ncbi:MAG: HD domain-containing protein [Lachnospiraceae bacterium]|nr:HD domain-containing protein [Lachnospiraceae bacterium]
MRFIKDIAEGDRVQDVYLCKYKQSAVTKNGKAYENVILQDKTGTLDAKIWEPNSMGIDEFEAMDYVDVVGEVTTFNGAKQLNIKRIRRVSEGEYDPANYLPVSSKNVEDMYRELMGYAAKIRNPYMRKLVDSFFVEDAEFIKRFKNHSAAKTVHHGFVGGLLEHTLGVTRICSFFTEHYEVLQYDLLIPAAMFHDIGKMWEISSFPENDYTDDGQLLGHIAIGYEIVGERIRKIEGFPPKLASELKHCILAHHGELEFGSPKKPAIVEAMALNFADVADDKLEMMKEIFDNAQGNDGWLGFNRFADSNLRKTSPVNVK